MEAKRIKRAFYTLAISIASVLGVAALVLLSQTSKNSDEFGRLHESLLIINAVGVLLLLLIISGNLYRLLRDLRRKVAGTRLKARMLTAIVGLVVAPVLIGYLFAVQFLNRGIETWFDVDIESGLADALTLSRSALDGRLRSSLESTRQMAGELMRGSAEESVATRG